MPAVLPQQLPWLLAGALGGYLLVMFTSPVRASLRDGFRAVRRYSALWVTLGAFGCAYELFQLAVRFYFFNVLPPENRPVLMWMRARWNDPELWWNCSPQSFWWMPPRAASHIMHASLLPALESTAGIFNLLVATFPLSAIAAVALLVNWEGHHAVLWRSLRKRFGFRGWLIYAGIQVSAVAAIVKCFLYVAPQLLGLHGRTAELWFQWAPVAEWLSFIFEYLVGVGVQIGLILVSYCWIRGKSFDHQHLIDFAIHRFVFVVKWSLLVMLATSVFIYIPLILMNFPRFQGWFPADPETVDERVRLARSLITILLLVFSTVQITLVFHSESWRKAVRDHLRFLARNWWPFSWFLLLAAIHFYLLHFLRGFIARGLGDGTAPGIAWSLLAPWIGGFVGAWLLASWVCLFKRCDTGRSRTENWIKY